MFGFYARFRGAYADWVDSQEELLIEFNAGLKPGQTPIALLANLNRNRPENGHATCKSPAMPGDRYLNPPSVQGNLVVGWS